MDERRAIRMCIQGRVAQRELMEHYAQAAKRCKTASDRNENLECREIIAAINPLFFKEIASQAGLKLKDIINLFRDSRVVRFFKAIKFSFKNLFGLLKKGYSAIKDLQKALLEYAKQTGIGRWTARQLDSERLREIDEWLKKHPKTKRIAGVAVGAILVYIWFNMSFIGNPVFDFDMSTMLMAIAGKFSLATIFSGAQGAALLVLFLTGLAGLSFPWPGPATAKFVLAVIGTIATKLGKRVKKASVMVSACWAEVEREMELLIQEIRAAEMELDSLYLEVGDEARI